MKLPNPLASRWGRLIAFFFLYVTEGIPLGFTSTAMAVHLSKSGLSDLQVGIFTGWLYIPWAFKWMVGPVVDLVYSKRLGHRRTWILCTQVMMVGTLLSCIPIQMTSSNVQLLTVIIFIHNLFCATQDVAIDALACNVLKPEERGLANGLMFAGQTLGIPLGGACVLYLTNGLGFLADASWADDYAITRTLRDGVPFGQTYWFVCGCVLMVTLFITLPMKEEAPSDEPIEYGKLEKVHHRLDDAVTAARARFDDGSARGWARSMPARTGAAAIRFLLPHDLNSRSNIARLEIGDYLITAGQSFFGSRQALAGLIFALLPAGAMALNLAIQKLLAVRLGMKDGEIADLEVVASVIWAVSCVIGGLLSDRVGHLKCLAVFLILMSLPTMWLGGQIHDSEWTTANSQVDSQAVSAAEASGEDVLSTADVVEKPEAASEEVTRPRAPQHLLNSFWWAVMAYMSCQGLMYGTRTAVFMQISNPKVAATQFTAYMALMNLVIAYSAWWQGFAIEKWGYATTLYIDAGFGLVCLAILPFLRLTPAKFSDETLHAPESLEMRLD